jgi:hypothetical protein
VHGLEPIAVEYGDVMIAGFDNDEEVQGIGRVGGRVLPSEDASSTTWDRRISASPQCGVCAGGV